MSLNRFVLLSKSVRCKKLLTPLIGQLGSVAKIQSQRSFRIYARNLVYAKDLFLGKVNKVNLAILYFIHYLLTIYGISVHNCH